MSRWQYGDWAMAAIVIEEDGDIYPLSELSEHHDLSFEGYYEEPFLLCSSYYRMNDLAGTMGARYEGRVNIVAHLNITDGNGNCKSFKETCEGYTCCGEDCYMLLIVTPGDSADSTTVEFQVVEKAEFTEAVGIECFRKWVNEYDGEDGLDVLDITTVCLLDLL